MSNLSNLPPELLSRIINYTATPPPQGPKPRDSSRYAGQHVPDGPTYAGLSYANIALATSPAPDIASLRAVRLVSKTFEQLSTSLLFSVVRVLPTEASAERYTKILQEEKLNSRVKKVVFQTRMQPDARLYEYTCEKMPHGDDYHVPKPFFIAALQQAARFRNLTHAELIFLTTCAGQDSWEQGPEDEDFRFEVLSAFYRGLVQATGLFHLSIKNLQNITHRAVMGKAFTPQEVEFQEDFDRVMARITQLGLNITTEDAFAAPENTLPLPELHSFFGCELKDYWLQPCAERLEYLKLYGNREVYWGFYPACNLPFFPALRTLVLGDFSITSSKQIDWILSHADTLEELILDDAMIGVAVTIGETYVDIPSRTIVYEKDYTTDPPGCQPKPRDHRLDTQVWLDATRWHHLFRRFAEELPNLRHFAINHSHWNSQAYEHADALCSVVRIERYGVFMESNWRNFEHYRAEEFVLKEWNENEKDRIQIEEPGCDEEDWQALKEVLAALERRR